ncbi:amidohydrolase family protein [Paenibacillus alginolyticus]|uniref:amidohydrolase family protein n=1 Tax=Paenibacillus alginolyticus TaxID=59839 RepID=UPI000426B6E7|nr:amidohydrolase family protein [Paenibacillus alginolyticus]MCY9668663.1 amidohydrolase family protein [Paenibacillus alginolyticus]
MRIDAHQHYWKTERGDYGWLTPEQGILYVDYMPEQLQDSLRRYQFERTIVVQAAPTLEETQFLLSLYDEYESIAGVVGWLDLDSPQFSEQYAKFRRYKGFVGFRPMLQDLPDSWILRPQVMQNMEQLVKDDFPLDLQLRPRHHPYILEAFRSFPTLRAVVDHAAKPFIAGRILEPWKTEMAELAAFPNVMCKLSGLVTEADQQAWNWMDLAPYVHHVIEVFGTDRVMFGSDWPVCLATCSYDEVYLALMNALPSNLTSEDHLAIFGGNAARFYQLL